MSPLRAELRSLLDVKAGIGYETNCPRCRNQATYDAKMGAVLTAKEDPAPYLADTRKELIRLRESNERLQKDLQQAKTWNQPMTRLRLGIYTAMGTGMITAAITIAKLLLGV